MQSVLPPPRERSTYWVSTATVETATHILSIKSADRIPCGCTHIDPEIEHFVRSIGSRTHTYLRNNAQVLTETLSPKAAISVITPRAHLTPVIIAHTVASIKHHHQSHPFVPARIVPHNIATNLASVAPLTVSGSPSQQITPNPIVPKRPAPGRHPRRTRPRHVRNHPHVFCSTAPLTRAR